MPVYEYRCRTCAAGFEVTRPMSQASDSATCPSGHEDTTRVLSVAMVGGRMPAVAASTGPSRPAAGPSGGCCGGGCCG